MRKDSVAIAALLALGAAADAEDVDPATNLMDEFSFGIASSFGEDVRTKLSQSELAQSDIDRIVDDFADNSAKCFLGSLIRQAEEQSLDVENLLSRAEAAFRSRSGDNFSESLDENELERKLEICIVVALENAGVTLD